MTFIYAYIVLLYYTPHNELFNAIFSRFFMYVVCCMMCGGYCLYTTQSLFIMLIIFFFFVYFYIIIFLFVISNYRSCWNFQYNLSTIAMFARKTLHYVRLCVYGCVAFMGIICTHRKPLRKCFSNHQ